jgi:ABC-type dipeptide/oligopeptide/nickel transport system ATPase subunit
MAANASRRRVETAPTPSRQLRFALILATPGHPGTDLPRAQRLLRELMANPEMLMTGERSLAFLELQQIDDHLTLEGENRRLQSDAGRADKERLANVNHRLQLETDENTRLRKELEEARAIAPEPSLIVCDEPVSSLDVSIAGQILNLLREIQERTGVSYLFISHDPTAVAAIADRIAVLRFGRIVEEGPAATLLARPQSAYTASLLEGIRA